MVSNNAKIKLIFDDPSETTKIVYGIVLQTFLSKERENYLLIQEALSSQLFIVTSRHYGFDVSKISNGKMAVAIYMLKEGTLTIEPSNFMSRSMYYAIGSIETIDDFPQEIPKG